MHQETGYLRVAGEHVEVTLAQPTGQTESLEGALSVVDGVVVLSFAGVVTNTSTAKQVDATARVFRLDGDRLESSFDMAAMGREMSRHLTSVMERVSGE